MKKEEKIEKIKETLKQYLLPDCLQPKWDGMSLHELSSIVLRELNKVEGGFCYCKKCGDPVRCEHDDDNPHIESICSNCV